MTIPSPSPSPEQPKRARPAAWLVTLLLATVIGLVRLKCGGPSATEEAIEAARLRNEAVGHSLIPAANPP